MEALRVDDDDRIARATAIAIGRGSRVVSSSLLRLFATESSFT